MSEANEHILTSGIFDSENREPFSNTIQNESSSTINEQVLQTKTSKNEISSDTTVSTSYQFNETLMLSTTDVCRICLQSDLDESNKCISPCFCRGSISKVHRTCLEKWLLIAGSSDCEICRFKYKIRRITKYSLLGSIKAWFFSIESKEEVKELFFDGCVVLITLPFLLLFSYVGFSITEHVFKQIKHDMAYRAITFGACTAIMCADLFFSIWTTYRIQHHTLHWFNFYKTNQTVIILDSKLPDDTL